jgi:drug/metabolite transporter (DMT)-like permease
VLVATVLALGSALLHAGWNLAAKRSADRFVALWGQFLAAGTIGALVLVLTGGVPVEAWAWAALSGAIHTPYLVGLARAYDHGDFSVAYPLARGGGALVAAVGGVVLLGDQLSLLSGVAILTVVAGMALLAVGATRAQVLAALVVAVAIGAYTTVDSHAAREVAERTYVCAAFVMAAVGVSVYGIATGQLGTLRANLPAGWRRHVVAGVTSLVAYLLVLMAVRRAPVGYVAALRESSVLLAVALGARVLSEGRARVRFAAAGLVFGGLVLLVVAA